MNSYLNDRKAIDRLKREYLEHKNLVVGFDFDCTIFDYHDEGLEIQPVVDLLKKCSDIGFTMCLHTKSENDGDSTKKAWHCNEILKLKIHYINASPLMRGKTDSHWPDKPFFSILLDDRTGLSASYNILKTTIKELNL